MAHVSDCAETLLKSQGRMWFLLCLVSLLSVSHYSLLSAIAHCSTWRLVVALIFPVNGIDPQKSSDNANGNSIHLRLYLWFETGIQLLNEISNSAVVAALYTQRQWLTEAPRGVFCHFVSTLIKEWQPYIHDYILCYLLWLQGQTNKPCSIAITFFIKPPRSYFPNTCPCFLAVY